MQILAGSSVESNGDKRESTSKPTVNVPEDLDYSTFRWLQQRPGEEPYRCGSQ